MSLLRGNPRYMLSPVDACLWRQRCGRISGKYAVAGFRDRAAGVEWRRVDADCSAATAATAVRELAPIALFGYFVATRVSPNARNTGLSPGDVLVGLDYEPSPRAATATALARLAGDWAGDGKLLLNYWRSADPRLTTALATAARSSPRSVLVTAPAEAAKEASRSQSGIWGTATLAICVTGDGGRGDATVSQAALGGTTVASASASSLPATTAPALQGGGGTSTNSDTIGESSVPTRVKRKDRRGSLGTEVRLSAAEKSATRAALPLRSADVELRTSLTDPVRHSLTPQNVSDETPLQDDRNYAVFKRLLQTGATLDEIVAEMRVAGVPPETTDRIVDSLRSIVATRSRHSAEDQSPAPNLIAPAAPTVPSSDGGNPRAAVLAMITKRSSPSCSGDGATNVRQRMGLDQVSADAILAFSKEFGLEILDESTPSVPGGKRAKLHWDAMTLDDGAMSASVWAADAFGGLDDDSDDDLDAGDEPQRGGFTTFGEDDMGRLATLFEEASTGGLLGGRSHALCVEDDADVLRLCGKTLANARVLDPQRSQNLAITIAPLARAYDGSFVALACALARLTAAPPRVSIEQLETLRAAMPTPDEKRLVASRVYDGVAHASALELDRLDAALIKTKLGTLSMPSSPIDPNKRAYGNAQDAADSAPLSPSAWERLHCEDIVVAAAHGAASVIHTVLPPDRATRLARLRAAFVADQLAPAEKFVFAVVECEAQLATFAGTATPDCAAAARGAVPSLLSSRLDALVTALGADHALGAVAERADAYADCAAKAHDSLTEIRGWGGLQERPAHRFKSAYGVVGLILDRAERKFYRDDASRDADDDGAGHGVAGRSKVDREYSTHPRSANAVSTPPRPTSVRANGSDVALAVPGELPRGDPLKDELLDFPECDGILAALDCARGADERVVASDAEKFKRDGLAKLEHEVLCATLQFAPEDEFSTPVGHRGAGAAEIAHPRPRTVARTHAHFFLGASADAMGDNSGQTALSPRDTSPPPIPDDWPPARRNLERKRLAKLLNEATARCDVLERESVSPLLVQAKELRKYFACEDSEPLDAIFSTLRDFLRALCESRDAQRRTRRAIRRERERDAPRRSERRSIRRRTTLKNHPGWRNEPGETNPEMGAARSSNRADFWPSPPARPPPGAILIMRRIPPSERECD
ncbi:hypothetical protein AURANDRAFT_72151 [Aureococcus anophagefferens]|uniref:Uncharacterized protein n=1 Tax=Aureococcus anophagefferens TaxID=44056 RepID=F0YGM6_AURAN|nr:hypothetical protein AURANDRAFT_72151 [Aureococcus anophagefferens]EGB05770.1 hypothetical protein AURANDRAFT_72151 [Aureococcus anophagefferens]|eukprot:XP_009039609.1 hypothetical protein AURANDRAFT_72151 [Aureococcus anophagefferens]